MTLCTLPRLPAMRPCSATKRRAKASPKKRAPKKRSKPTRSPKKAPKKVAKKPAKRKTPKKSPIRKPLWWKKDRPNKKQEKKHRDTGWKPINPTDPSDWEEVTELMTESEIYDYMKWLADLYGTTIGHMYQMSLGYKPGGKR